ncbi:MAG TPA: thioredoxin domain-containing protein [Terriglobales bacterium]|nr:thioredoxin domain-containing protein [Terriglobales bacterium]
MKSLAIYLVAIIAVPLLMAVMALAAGPQDTSALHPPKGAKVAIVVFEDLQCPQCARTAPLLEQAAKTYKIPVVRHDFPLPKHNWSYDAAILARYFDTHSVKVGNEFRDAVFANQIDITPQNLRAFAEKFASEHKVDLPFVVDPQGELAAKVNADRTLGNRVGIDHTPTVYIVTDKASGTPFVEVKDNTQLFQTIDSMKRD